MPRTKKDLMGKGTLTLIDVDLAHMRATIHATLRQSNPILTETYWRRRLDEVSRLKGLLPHQIGHIESMLMLVNEVFNSASEGA
jgi:hypothetical protein